MRTNKYRPLYTVRKTQSISVEKTAFYKAIEDEAFFSSVIKLVIDGKEEQVVVRDLQRHPFKPLLTLDFLRVDATHEITMNVPLHVVNEEKCGYQRPRRRTARPG